MKPVLQALLVADRIYEDKATGKKIVAGIFHRLLFNKDAATPKKIEKNGVTQTVIPGGLVTGSPYVYISLTEIVGERGFVLRYVELDEYKPLFQTEFTIDCTNPLETVEVVLPLPPLPVSKAGIFALELLVDDNEPIGSFRIQVQEISIQGKSDADA